MNDIEKDVKSNIYNPDSYIKLAEFYENINKYKAYLCYENAFFLSKGDEHIAEKMEEIRKEGWAVPKAAMVILNYNLKDDIRNCIDSIRETTPNSAREIIVVDNGSTDGSLEYLRSQNDIKLLENKENVGFPKGCNQGIEMAENESDIFLVNNDTLMCNNTLFWLRMALYSDEKHGTAGCVTNNCGHNQMVVEKGKTIDEYVEFAKTVNVPADNPYEYRCFLVGFAVLIKRKLINTIGILDEIYSPGNYEDNDLGMRSIEAGYDNVLVHNSFIVHLGSKSFSKRNDYSTIFDRNHKYFDSKYEINSDKELNYLNGVFYENFKKIKLKKDNPNVLVINCGMAADVLRLRYEFPNVNFECYGSDMSVARFSSRYNCLDVSYISTVRNVLLKKQKYDVILVNIDSNDNNKIDDYINIINGVVDKGAKVFFAVANKRFYENWMDTLLEGKDISVGKNGIASEHEWDALFNANDFRCEYWTYFFLIGTDTKKMELVDQISKYDEHAFRIKCRKYGIMLEKM